MLDDDLERVDYSGARVILIVLFLISAGIVIFFMKSDWDMGIEYIESS